MFTCIQKNLNMSEQLAQYKRTEWDSILGPAGATPTLKTCYCGCLILHMGIKFVAVYAVCALCRYLRDHVLVLCFADN